MKKINLLTIFIMLSSIIITCLLTTLPNIVPMHININGDIDQYGSKWFILLGPIIAFIVAASIQVYLRKTKNKSLEALQTLMSTVLVAILGVCWLPYIIATEIGLKNANIIFGAFLGSIFIFMGNYMGLLKTNAVVGIRVKWTLADEEIWQKTHRLGGYVMVAAGILILILSLIEFLFKIKLLMISILTVTSFIVLITIVYSYALYKQKSSDNDKTTQ